MAANKSKSDLLAEVPPLFITPPELLFPELELPLLVVVFEEVLLPDDEALADAWACC